MRTSSRTPWLLVLLLGWGASACTQRVESDGRRPNLILISIDTLRADRLGCYGYERPTSPTLDALAERGVRFSNVIAESGWTLPSTMTLFTGLPPAVHGVVRPRKSLPESIPTLFQLLARDGYRTFGYTAGGFVGRKWGFDRGFEEYHDRRSDLATVLQGAEQRIASLDRSEAYALFLHTYDVHCPYDPPASFVEPFRTRPEEDHLETELGCGNNGSPIFNELDLTPGQGRFLSDQYDAGVRWVDEVMAGFVAFLDGRGELDETVLIVTSDHGEEFGEHGQIGHQKSLQIELLRVPLLMLAPGLEARVVEERVGLADVMPTVLELLDVGSPESLQGRSLVPLAQGDAAGWVERPVFSELDFQISLRSVVDGMNHFIVREVRKRNRGLKAPVYRLYDLAVDPLEQVDLAAEDRAVRASYHRLVSAHFEFLKTLARQAQEVEMSDDDLRDLEALGYVELDSDS